MANDDTRNDFFYNNGDGTFSEISLLAGCAYSFNGVAQGRYGSYHRRTITAMDGSIFLLLTSLMKPTHSIATTATAPFTDVIYEARLGKESYLYVGFGTGFFDADSDGWLDLFIANGHILDNIEDTHDILTYRHPINCSIINEMAHFRRSLRVLVPIFRTLQSAEAHSWRL